MLHSTILRGQTVVLTTIPEYGQSGYLAGYVTNANVSTNAIVVFIYVAGDWYSKPACANALVPIQPNGAWSANISPDPGVDVSATEIAVFLVPTNHEPPCVNGEAGLTMGPDVEASTYAVRVAPESRQLVFSGYDWSVRPSTTSPSGPGPNYFSDSTNNVWVDSQGLLHLKITRTNAKWQCVELVSDRSFGYGQYRFTVQADVNDLDASAVLGMFTYSYDTAYNDREIDLELSHWNFDFGPSNVEDYAIAPYDAGQLRRGPLPEGVTNTTHSMIWQSNIVAFQTVAGSFASPPAASNLLASFSCGAGIPPAGGEQVHVNLWLNKGNAPVKGQPVEIVVSQFEFVPLGPPLPARLLQARPLPGGGAQLTAQGASDWHYDILTSSNLISWTTQATILATNNCLIFCDTNPLSAAAVFYRLRTAP